MTFTQQTFLGASIRYFNSSVGWSNQGSTLEVGLVEDPSNGDSFNPPEVGSHVNFDYSGWRFGGFLEKYTTQYGQDGNPVHSVSVQDPRELLSGVQLILNDYTGPSAMINNLYNIYGYWESFGFGNAHVNETGMPWWRIVQGFANIQITNPIKFHGENFLFTPFLTLPGLLPQHYRVGGDSISALEFVDDICAATANDYFITMWQNIIFIKLVPKKLAYAPNKGSIERFVSSVEGAVAKDYGYELLNDITSKFLVGGKVADLYIQPNSTVADPLYLEDKPSNPASYYDNTILPYWGYNAYDRLIIGTGDFSDPLDDGSGYTFTIDGRPIVVQTGNYSLVNYKTDLAEMRFIKMGRENWEFFLWWKSEDKDSIHYRKASMLGISDGLNNTFKDFLKELPIGDKTVIRPVSAAASGGKRLSDGSFENKTQEKKIDAIYEYLRIYATEFYGRKFMVRVPFVLAAYEDETNYIKLSVKAVDSAFVEEEKWSGAAGAGILPYNPEKFTTSDNRIKCFVKYSNMQTFEVNTNDNIQCKYNLSNLSPSDYILDQYPNLKKGKMRENLFVMAQIDSDRAFVFLDPATFYSPRVVITLPGPVGDNDENSLTVCKALSDELKFFLKKKAEKDGDPVPDEAELDAHTKKLFHKIGGDTTLWYGKESMFYLPDMAAIPLESQILRYGPWWATGGDGRVEYSVDTSLVPWNYAGYSLLELTGLSRVEDALLAQQSSETGTVQFPGVPDIPLGNVLVSNGPIITSVEANISEQGVTTTYRMNRWAPQFGRIGKYNVDRLQRISKVAQEQRKAFRVLFGYKEPLRLSNAQYSDLIRKTTRSKGNRSSINMLVGDIEWAGTEEGVVQAKTSAYFIPSHKLISQIDNDNYAKTAGISLDGVFVPYTTNTDPPASKLPHFEEPDGDAGTPDAEDLNPFGDGGIAITFQDTPSVPTDRTGFSTELVDGGYNGTVKGVGFKAPMVVGGWGYDTKGIPVPHEEGSEEFVEDWKNRADLWKVGPLDIRWDDSKKIWTAAGTTGLVPGKVVEIPMTGRHGESPVIAGSGLVDLYRIANSGEPGQMQIVEFKALVYSDYTPEVPVGTWITVEKDKYGVNWIVGADCF